MPLCSRDPPTPWVPVLTALLGVHQRLLRDSNRRAPRESSPPACSQVLASSHRADLQAKAVELEHETFRSAKMVNLYKASVLKKVSQGASQVVHAHGLRRRQGSLFVLRPPAGLLALQHRPSKAPQALAGWRCCHPSENSCFPSIHPHALHKSTAELEGWDWVKQ